MDIVKLIEDNIRPGQLIPKPEAQAEFRVKGWGTRRNERALVYLIPNHQNPAKPYQKGITVSEWRMAHSQLTSQGCFSREWFDRHLSQCSKEGSCNFTTIGGIFMQLGLARYSRGQYAVALLGGQTSVKEAVR